MQDDDNVMAPHFRKAVNEIDTDIQKLLGDVERLQTARHTLMELYGAGTELPAVETVAPTSAEATARKPSSAKAAARKPKSTRAKAVKPARKQRQADQALGEFEGQPERLDTSSPTERDTAAALHSVTAEGKPDSLGAAMKYLIRCLPGPFTQEQLRAALEADPDFKKLLEQAHTSTFYGNLAYWAKTVKLAKTGEGDAATYINLKF